MVWEDTLYVGAWTLRVSCHYICATAVGTLEVLHAAWREARRVREDEALAAGEGHS